MEVYVYVQAKLAAKGCVALRLCHTSSATDISASENLNYADIVRYVYAVFIAAIVIWTALSFSSSRERLMDRKR
jgi:hypothetical protein